VKICVHLWTNCDSPESSFESEVVLAVDIERPSPQTSVGNLGIAIELMLKAIIARKNLFLLFEEPNKPELKRQHRILLACPDDLPEVSFRRVFRDFHSGLRFGERRTIGFEECYETVYTFLPHLRDRLEFYLNYIRPVRNASLHFVLPSVEAFEAESVAYAAIRVQEELDNVLNSELGPEFCEGGILEFLKEVSYKHSEEDKEFVEAFREEILKRVRGKFKGAKEKSKNSQGGPPVEVDIAADERWKILITVCPVCEHDATLQGDTVPREVHFRDSRDPWAVETEKRLDFFASHFNCPHCELALDDIEELQIAGLRLRFDRSDELEEYIRGSTPEPHA
jgi:hypothetical protein